LPVLLLLVMVIFGLVFGGSSVILHVCKLLASAPVPLSLAVVLFSRAVASV
jgi:hypothetical protein